MQEAVYHVAHVTGTDNAVTLWCQQA
uniref:Uncharacterized protein n=1 Tax=Anguilla anguilla TaxID=7936 RepID=A0A0E9SQ67_ANGAN